MQTSENQGYAAQSSGKSMSANPYLANTPEYWAWRKGFLEAFKDSN